MDFNYFDSIRKHLFEYYDSLMLIGVNSFNNQNFLMYAIEWDSDLSKIEYMLTKVTYEEIERFKKGVKEFLQTKLNEKQLYHYTFSFIEGSDLNEIRLLTEEEAIESFPTDEFKIEHDYTSSICWVI